MIEGLSTQRKDLLAAPGHLLVMGGPGSGKSTIALLKASAEFQAGGLSKHQHVLFLSFARPTIARVAELATKLIDQGSRASLEIGTYHGFFWKLLRSHGYLIFGPGIIRILPPPEAAVRLADMDSREAREAEKLRLFEEEGFLHFDLFATVATDLLVRSKRLKQVICKSYPIVIVDEFQDTNEQEWAFIRALGDSSRLIALADPEQRIYEFRGADPKRIGEFTEAFKPKIFDFGTDNFRSNGRDITTFGNDLLVGKVAGKTYQDVTVVRYQFYQGLNSLFPVKASVIKRIKELLKEPANAWSLAVLVPSKRMMLQISDYLDIKSDGLPALRHDVALDTEAPALAAIALAGLLEGGNSASAIADRLVEDLIQHIRGRKGNESPPQAELKLAIALGTFLTTGAVTGKNRRRIVDSIGTVAEKRMSLSLSGDPEADWLAVRRLLSDSDAPEIQQLSDDVKYLRLLHKGAVLRSRLGDLWRQGGGYRNAPAAVRDALMQEHFSSTVRDWRGIHVMTIHKAKGKEFTEVVIAEGLHQGKIVRQNATPNEVAQARLALRVAVTRATNHATILTPKSDPCPLL
ncbi:DNA helicase UvrD [Betaproteobacteria bacterium GR16-43]|nr:DNA helicase UvrD [Betaproteobacteria bacterium GR16-43]